MARRQATLDLLVLPCAGASATMYLRWRRALPTWLNVVPIELPGRGGRSNEPYVTDFDSLVAKLCDEQAAALQGNFVLLGHSMGALLAYGMALRQRALSRPMPQLLIVSASAAPRCRSPERYANRHDDATLIADLRKQGATPDEVFAHADMLRMTLDTLAADYAVCASFPSRATQALALPVHAWGGRHDDIGQHAIEQWHHETRDRFSVDWFDGGHFFIRDRESDVLAALIRVLSPFAQGAGDAAVALA
ncbi:thioesterase II family protein [Pigmentiphaga litoralis]|uniref:thioesterase II family protein n=1 Tax=Pigmentiphaga litoralis TaxID=516702 RepID=UPI003B4326DE